MNKKTCGCNCANFRVNIIVTLTNFAFKTITPTVKKMIDEDII